MRFSARGTSTTVLCFILISLLITPGRAQSQTATTQAQANICWQCETQTLCTGYTWRSGYRECESQWDYPDYEDTGCWVLGSCSPSGGPCCLADVEDLVPDATAEDRVLLASLSSAWATMNGLPLVKLTCDGVKARENQESTMVADLRLGELLGRISP